MKATGVERCNQYVDDVLSGKILAPITVKLACKRFNQDFEKEEIYFDERAANVAVKLVEKFKHVKGVWQGKPLIMEHWQCFVICNIFGWKWVKNQKRRFRRAYLRIPRKNAKSTLAIAIALLFFGPDREPGAEIYLGATGRDEANDLLFNPAKFMVKKDPKFQQRYGIEINASNMVIPGNFSKLKAVIKKPSDGGSPHFAEVDEYHEHDNSDQYDTFDTGMGAREQPLLMVTTTAGSNLAAPCYELDQDCIRQLEENPSIDESRFILIYAPDPKDEWDDFETIRKVNPNIGVSVSEDYLIDQLSIAKRTASKQNSFRTKHVNDWVGAASSWMNMLNWQLQSKPSKFDEFKDCPARAHVDLASRKDVCAINVLWKNGSEYFAKQWFFVPEGAVENNDNYQKYKNTGEIIVTPGNKIDQAFIEQKIKELHKEFDIELWSFDDYQGDYIMTRLMDDGLPVVNYGQNVKNFSTPMKEVEANVIDRTLWHDGNQCMTWMIGNVVCFENVKGDIYPRKSNKNDKNCKIDGPVSLIATMGTWMAEQDESAPGIVYV